MHPVLFKVPFLGPVYTYGALVALAFVTGIAWVRHESKRVGQNPGRATDLAFYIILAAILGSRVLYVLFSAWDQFVKNPLMFFYFRDGGLVFYGGLLAALAVAVWYFRKYKLPVLAYCDTFAPAIAIGHAIGRLGCFMAGCCFGRPVGHAAWYALIFPGREHGFAPPGVALYPTQLIESGGEFIIFWVLFALRKFKRFDGQLIATYLILYGVLRFLDEFLRGDMDRGFVVPGMISASQLISIIMVVFGALLYVLKYRRAS